MISVMDTKFRGRPRLVPVIAQEHGTGRVLMLAYANREAVNMTLTTGLATFWSRSRKKLWVKGKTSGNFLKIVRVLADCDLDALLYVVRLPKNGGACHEKNKRGNYRKSCFFRRMAKKI